MAGKATEYHVSFDLAPLTGAEVATASREVTPGNWVTGGYTLSDLTALGRAELLTAPDASGMVSGDAFWLYQVATSTWKRTTGDHVKNFIETGLTMDGQLSASSAGSAATPSIAISTADLNTGFYPFGADQIGVCANGAAVGYFSANGIRIGAGSDFALPFAAYRTGATSAALLLQSEAACGVLSYRMSADISGAVNGAYKGRGTWAAAAFPNQNDITRDDIGGVLNSTSTAAVPVPINASRIRHRVIAPTPSATDVQSDVTIAACPAASVTLTDVANFQASNTAGVTFSYPVKLPVYTIATLPAAGTVNRMVWVSDLGGGAGPVVDNGSAWERLTDGHEEINSDGTTTLTVLTRARQIRNTTTLTANRSVTLSATRAHNGARFKVARTGGGAFTLDVGGLKSLSTGQYCEVRHNGTAWYLAEFGAL